MTREKVPVQGASEGEDLTTVAPEEPTSEPETSEPLGKKPRTPASDPEGSEGQSRRLLLVVLVVILLGTSAVTIYALKTSSPTSPPAYAGQLRTYYIAANEVEWNYTPTGLDQVTGLGFGANGSGDVLYTEHNAAFLGPTFLKCIYQQYTSGSFQTLDVRPPSQAYLGILGPVIYAEVGDTIHVHFRNDCRFPESIHPQGLSYPANSSGISYNGSGAAQDGGAVPPGGEYNYTWDVPNSAGPGTGGPMAESSVLWTYASGASLLNGSDTGLVGPIIISARGEGNPDGSPANVADNVVIYENIFNEANSPYLGQNLLDHAGNISAAVANESNPSWQQSLLKYAINGYIFGNMPAVAIPWGESVRWYVMAEGNDMHSVQWSGGPVNYMGEETDTVGLLPGVTAVANMVPAVNGTYWVGSGDTNDIAGGMLSEYSVGAFASISTSAAPAPSSMHLVPVASAPLLPMACPFPAERATPALGCGGRRS